MVRVGGYGMRWGPYDKAVELAVDAERNGLDWIIYADQLCSSRPRSMWDPEVTDVAGMIESLDAYYDPGPLVASAAARTSTIGFMWGVIDAVRRHPSMIAQTLLTLDHTTKGRTITVLANGENKQMKPYGISRKGANDKLWDSVQMVRMFLERCDPITFEGRVWKLDRAKVDLPPYGDTPPEVWVAGGGPEVFEMIGRWGDGWLTYAPGATEDDPAVLAAQLAEVHRHAESAGRDPAKLLARADPHRRRPRRRGRARTAARPPHRPMEHDARHPDVGDLPALGARAPIRRRLDVLARLHPAVGVEGGGARRRRAHAT